MPGVARSTRLDAADQRDDILGLLPLEEIMPACDAKGVQPPRGPARRAYSSVETGANRACTLASGRCCRIGQLQFDVTIRRLQISADKRVPLRPAGWRFGYSGNRSDRW